MRIGDVVPPAVDPHPRPGTPAERWPGQLVIALERLPQAAYVWDDDDPAVVWDDPAYVWDAPFVGAGLTDVWCDFHGLETVVGDPDEHGLFPPAQAILQLRDPGDGRYRKRTADGRLVYWSLGRRLEVWWLDAGGEPWWLFAGTVATWHEQLDGTVTIEAFARAGELAQDHGAPWSPGTAGQLPRPRMQAVATAAAYSGTWNGESDVGDVALAVPPPQDRAALELIQQAGWSDGGILFADADGALFYRDRRWRDGRRDQTVVPTFTDNVCDTVGAVVVWEPEQVDADEQVAAVVAFTNTAGTTVTASPAGGAAVGTARYTHPDVDLWQTAPDGQMLAQWVADARAVARMALAQARLYLHDARYDLWAVGTDLRVGDRVTWLHDDHWADGTVDVVNLALVVSTVRHAVTPDAWVVEVATSPAVDYLPVQLWDRSPFGWDDPHPDSVWS